MLDLALTLLLAYLRHLRLIGFAAATVDAEKVRAVQKVDTSNLTEWLCTSWVSFSDG